MHGPKTGQNRIPEPPEIYLLMLRLCFIDKNLIILKTEWRRKLITDLLEGFVEFGDIVAVDNNGVEAETFQTNPKKR